MVNIPSYTTIITPLINSTRMVELVSSNSINGSIYLNSSIVIGTPGTNVLFLISSSSLDQSKIQTAFPNQFSSTYYLSVYLRYCERGEYMTADNKCSTCDAGYYTLIGNQSECNECPDHATC